MAVPAIFVHDAGEYRLTDTGTVVALTATAYEACRRSGVSPSVLDDHTGQQHHKIIVKQAAHVEAVAFSPDGKTLAVGRGWNDSDIHLYDVASGRLREVSGG